MMTSQHARQRSLYYYLSIFITLFVCSFWQVPAYATISGAHGMEVETELIVCGGTTGPGNDRRVKFRAKICTLTPLAKQYVPHSGNYKVEINAGLGNTISNWDYAQSTAAYFDETIPINKQNVTVSGSDYDPGAQPPAMLTVCYLLVDTSGNKYILKTTLSSSCTGDDPLPPTPPPQPTSCSINNGNALDVTLGTLERAQLATTPGTGTAQHIQIPVQCTGNVDSIPVNMQLNYTPLTISGIQTVKSSANGIGVSIIYNNDPLSNSDIKSISFVPGTNQLDLAFEAVRDPAVAIRDVPTGAFTASATVIMTQQ